MLNSTTMYIADDFPKFARNT